MKKNEIIINIKEYLNKSLFYRIFNNKKFLNKILENLNNKDIEIGKENYYDQFIEFKNKYENLNENYIKLNNNFIKTETIADQKIETIDILKENNEKLNEEIQDLKSQNLLINRNNEKLNEEIQDLKSQNLLINRDNEKSKEEIQDLKNQRSLINRDNEKLTRDLMNQKDITKEVNNKLNLFSEKINKNSENTENLTKLFKGSPASKGKIAEIRLKEIIENSVNNLNLYTFNLKVGTGIVEFAIRAKENDNWIPIDSKFIEPDLDLNQEPIIDQKYKTNVLKRAKEISTKYLDKKITQNFGILVLQNEYIYGKISEDYEFFNEAQKLNIYISSPTTFIQFLRTINTISFNLELLKDVDGFKKDIRNFMKNIQNFYNNTEKGIKLLNTAFDSDLKKINQKSEIVLNKIDLINQKQNIINIE